MNPALEAWRQDLDGEIVGDVVTATDPEDQPFKLRLDPSKPDGIAVWGSLPEADLREWVSIKSDRPILVTDDLLDLVEENVKARACLLSPILMQQSSGMIAAYRGVGKTLLAHGIGLAVASGGTFLRWRADKPRKVVLVDGEMPAKALQDRARAALAGLKGPRPAKGFIRLVAMDRQPLGFSLNLADPAHQALVEAEIGDAELLILDNIATLVRGGSPNDEDAWATMQAWLLQLRRRGVAVLLVHHAARAGNPRGSVAREDILDVVIELRRPGDYDPSQGARFEVHLTKARGIFGADARPFEAKLETRTGVDHWSCADIRNLEFEKLRDLQRQGFTVRQIAEETGQSKTTVARKLQEGANV